MYPADLTEVSQHCSDSPQCIPPSFFFFLPLSNIKVCNFVCNITFHLVRCCLSFRSCINYFKVTLIFKQEPVQLAKWSRARACQISYRLSGLVLVLLFHRDMKVLEQKQLLIKAYHWAEKSPKRTRKPAK